MRSRYCSATSRAQPLARAHPVRDRDRGRAARVDHRHDARPPIARPPPPGPGTIRGTWKKLAVPPRGVRERVVDRQRRLHLVGAGRAVERHRVRHRLDRAGVERAQGVDVLEDRAQIVGHRRDLLVGQPQAREQRELANFVGGDARHGRGLSYHGHHRAGTPARFRTRLRGSTEFATRRDTRYSVGSDMTLSGNRFRALVVCLAPASRWRSAATAAGACRMRRRSPPRTRRSCRCASRSAPIARRRSRCWDSAPPPPVPRPTCSAWSIRWPPPRPIRDACCATSISRTARWSRAAAPSISRSSAASASAWGVRQRR